MLDKYGGKFYPLTIKSSAENLLQSSKGLIEWTNSHVPQIDLWLSNNQYNGTTTVSPGSASMIAINSVLLFAAFVIMLLKLLN